MTTIAAPGSASAGSEETSSGSGNFTPGRKREFSRASASLSRSSGFLASSVTSRPSPDIITDRVVPQVVAPTTATFADKGVPASNNWGKDNTRSARLSGVDTELAQHSAYPSHCG